MDQALLGRALTVSWVGTKTDELRRHDVLADLYADRLPDPLDHMLADPMGLGLLLQLDALAADLSGTIADIRSGTGRLATWSPEALHRSHPTPVGRSLT